MASFASVQQRVNDRQAQASLEQILGQIAGGGGSITPPRNTFSPLGVPQFTTEPGDRGFSLSQTPDSQAQFPAAAAQERLFENQTRAGNVLVDAAIAGFDVEDEVYAQIQEVGQKGFAERALTLGEKLIGWLDGPVSAVNLFIQDMIGGEAAEGKSDPTIGDYFNTVFGGMEDAEGFQERTGLQPHSRSETLSMFGWGIDDDTSFAERFGRGLVHFGLEVGLDPLTYVTFGLSGLGQQVAKAAARGFADDAVREALELMGKTGVKASNEYVARLARNAEDLKRLFVKDMDEIKKLNDGFLPEDMIQEIHRVLGKETDATSLLDDELLELALRKAAWDDVGQHVVAKRFGAIDPAAREMLPKYARGGVRISVPFGKRALSRGFEIPGTHGLGRDLVGQRVRDMSLKMAEKFPLYDKFAKTLSKGLDNMDQERALLRAIGKPVEEGGIHGWQYHLIATSMDNVTNGLTTDNVVASLNSHLKVITDLAEEEGIDLGEVWSEVLNSMQKSSLDTAIAEQADIFAPQMQKIFTPGTGVLKGRASQALLDEVARTSLFIQRTFEGYTKALSSFDPNIAKNMIEGYVPTILTPEGAEFLREIALRTGVDRTDGSTIADLLAQLLNSVGQGGRLESAMGGSRLTANNSRTRLGALALTDDGAIMIDGEILNNVPAAPIIDEAGQLVNTLSPRQFTITALNKELVPALEKLAEEAGIHAPKGWAQKLFKENPLDIAADYVKSLETAIKGFATVRGLRAAGLVMDESVDISAQRIAQAMMDNMVRGVEKTLQLSDGPKVIPEGQADAPTEWLLNMIPQTTKNRLLGGGLEEAGERGTLSHLETFEEAGGALSHAEVLVSESGHAIITPGIDGQLLLHARGGAERVPTKVRRMTAAEETLYGEEAAEQGLFLGDHMRKDFRLAAAPASSNLPPLYHGFSGGLPDLGDLSEAPVKSGNLFGPGLYSSDSAATGTSYRGYKGGDEDGLAALKWTGDGEPRVLDLPNDPAPPSMRGLVSDELQPGRMLSAFSSASSQARLRQLIDDPTTTAEDLYDAFKEAASTLGVSERDHLYTEMNLALREEFDVMRYHGGVRTQSAEHNAYVWLDTENLELAQMADGADTAAHNLGDVFDQAPWQPKAKGGHMELEEVFDLGRDARIPKTIRDDFEEIGLDATAENAKEIANLIRVYGTMGRTEFMQQAKHLFGAKKLDALYMRTIKEDFPALAVPDKAAANSWQVIRDEFRNATVHAFRGADGQVQTAVVFTDVGEAFPALEWAITEGMDETVTRTLLRNEIVPHITEIVRSGEIKITRESINAVLENETFTEHGLRLVHAVMKHHINTLPPSLKDAVMKRPAELIETTALHDDLIDELQAFFEVVAGRTHGNQLVPNVEGVAVSGKYTGVQAHLDALRDAANELGERGMTKATQIFRGVGNQEITFLDKKGFVNPELFSLGGSALQNSVIHHDMGMWVKQIARNANSIYTPEGVAALKRTTNETLRWWRAMATIARPTFHIRNFVGAAWNNMLVGVGPLNYAFVRHNALKLRKALSEGLDFEEALLRLPKKSRPAFKAAWEENVFKGFSTTEFRKLTAQEKNNVLSLAKVWDEDQFALTRMGSKFMESIEDFHRMAAFHTWYDAANPSSAKVAREMVNAVHFDYTNLTPLETTLKSWIPFFVWTRRNLPLQMRQMVENPRMIARYKAMMNALDDNSGGAGDPMPLGDGFTAFAAGTGYKVNAGTPFWARWVIDPDLPVTDLFSLPSPTDPSSVADFANDMLGPHVTALFDLNAERDFGDVNAPAPFSVILKSLAAVGLYDTTMSGDVRVPYMTRTAMETALPFSRETVDLLGGPTDPNRQARLGVEQDAGFLESTWQSILSTGAKGVGLRMNTPADVRGTAARSRDEIDAIIQDLRLQGLLAPSQG